MAVDPVKIQSVLRKASDQQLMGLLRRPDSIPSMFVQQELRRRNQARQAAKADMSKMAMAQRPQLTPPLSRTDQMPQDPRQGAMPMAVGGGTDAKSQKELLLKMFQAGRMDIIEGVARDRNDEVGNFAKGLLTSRQNNNTGIAVGRKPKFTDYDMTDPKNNFPGSRLNYSIAPMIKEKIDRRMETERSPEFHEAKAREKSDFLEALESEGIKSVTDGGLSAMDLENEFLEGEFDPEGKFAYGRPKTVSSNIMSSGLPVSQGGASSDRWLMENDLMTPQYMDYLAKRNRAKKRDEATALEPITVRPNIPYSTTLDRTAIPRGPDFAGQKFQGFTPSGYRGDPRLGSGLGGITEIIKEVNRSDDNYFKDIPSAVAGDTEKGVSFLANGIPPLKDHMSWLDNQLKDQEVEDAKNMKNMKEAFSQGLDWYGQAMSMIGNQPEFDGDGNLIVNQQMLKPNKNRKITDPTLTKDVQINTQDMNKHLSLEQPILTLENIGKGIHTAGGLFPHKDYYEPLPYDKIDAVKKDDAVTSTVIPIVKSEEEKNTIESVVEKATDNDNTTTPEVDYTQPFVGTDKANMDNAFKDKDGKNLSAGDALKKQYQNSLEADKAKKDGASTGGVGNAIASQYGALTDAQNKLIEAMKPNGGDRFWELVANFGANLAASETPNFMQATAQAMQQTLAEAKDMKKEDRQMLIDQAKVAVDLEFKRAELGLQLARINASAAKSGTSSVAFERLREQIAENIRRQNRHDQGIISSKERDIATALSEFMLHEDYAYEQDPNKKAELLANKRKELEVIHGVSSGVDNSGPPDAASIRDKE